MQPQDHMSTAGPYVGALNNSSGARYQRVTTCCVSWRLSVGFFEGGDDAAADSSSSRRSASFSGSVRARPKSQTLSLTGSTSNNMLACARGPSGHRQERDGFRGRLFAAETASRRRRGRDADRPWR